MIAKLASSGYGCRISQHFVGALSYADDTLLSPSLQGLKYMLKKGHFIASVKDDQSGQHTHELLQYSVRTINNSKVSRITYPRKMHALYEKRV